MSKKKKVIMIVSIVSGVVLTYVAVIVIMLFDTELFHTDRYKGEHPHLYTVAVNSLLTKGDILAPEYGAYAAEVTKLDEDEYGRELFIYYASPITDRERACSVLICQKHDDTYAYWYDDENYILAPYYGYAEEKENGVYEDKFKGITEAQIEELKARNGWGKEIDERRLSSAQIVRDPLAIHVKRKEDAKPKNFYNGLFAEEGYEYWYSYNAVRDKDGRSIYCISGNNYDESFDSAYKYKYIIAVTSPDGEFIEDCWFIYDSPKTYAENLSRVKQAAGWNMKAI